MTVGSGNPANSTVSVASQYGPDYFESYGRLGPVLYSRENPHWLEFFGRVADEIIRQLNPRTALDVGCAKGFLVECLRDRGVDAYGSDISEYAISQVRPDIKPYCWVTSARDPIAQRYDVITCIEVCEHLAESEAREAIQQMTSHSDTILFSSTPGDFHELTHVNVHPIIDWLRLLAQFSFAPDESFEIQSYIPQAMLLRRSRTPPDDQTLCRFADLKNKAIAMAEVRKQALPEIAALQRELETVLNSKGWKLLDIYRQLRFRVKHPVRQAIDFVFPPPQSYRYWIKHTERPSYSPKRIKREIAAFRHTPKISIVMPVYNTPKHLLNAAIRSVHNQLYRNWELCICDDASTDENVRVALRKWQARDPRIKVTHSTTNEHISGASNRALALASGEFIGLLDHDDEITPDALSENIKLLQQHPDADMIYSDEDMLDGKGRRVDPFHKPEWSPALLLESMYTCHFGVYRRSLIDEIGGFRKGFEGSQDYDLVLRLIERTNNVHHIPKILYHWRKALGSCAASIDSKPYAPIAAKKAIAEYLERRQIRARVIDGDQPGYYKVIRLGETGSLEKPTTTA